MFFIHNYKNVAPYYENVFKSSDNILCNLLRRLTEKQPMGYYNCHNIFYSLVLLSLIVYFEYV